MSTEFEDLVDETLRRLGDTDGNYWTRTEIAGLLNRGQEKFVRDTHCLMSQSPVIMRESEDVYELPTDALEIIAVHGESGVELNATTSVKLQNSGANLLNSESSNPQAYYSDLDGPGKVRFYPRPSSTLVQNSVDVLMSAIQEVNLALPTTGLIGNVYTAIAVQGDSLYVSDETNIYEFDRDYRLVRTIAHGATPFMMVVVPRDWRGKWINPTLRKIPGTIITIDGTSTVRFYYNDGTTGTFTAAGSVFGIAKVSHFASHVFYSVGLSGDLYRLDLSTILTEALVESSFGTIYESCVPKPSGDETITDATYVPVGKVWALKSDGTAEWVWANAIRHVHDIGDGTAYIAGSSVTSIYLWNFGTLLTSTTTEIELGRTAASVIGYADGRIWYVDDSGYIVEGDIDGTTYTERNRIGAATLAPNSYTDASKYSAFRDEFLFMTSLFGLFGMGPIFEEAGAVVSIADDANTVTFEDEQGIVTDWNDDGVVLFQDQEGSITALRNAAKAMIISYLKRPDEGEVQIEEPDALVYYAIYHALLNDAERMDVPRAQIFKGEFDKIKGRCTRYKNSGFNHSPRNRSKFF